MNCFALSGVLAAVSSLGVGSLVLYKSPNKKLGKIWFLFALSVAMWEFSVTWWALANSPEEALLAARTGYLLGVLWIAAFFNHFVGVFLEVKSRKVVIANYVIAFSFLPVIYTPLFFSHARWFMDFMFYPVGGKIFPSFFVWWVSLVFLSHYQLISAYKRVSKQKQSQIKYFFLATAIGFTGGSLCYLPNFEIDLYPGGNYAVMLYPIIMSYAILKHQLMDVRIVIQKTVVSVIGLLVAVSAYIFLVSQFTRRGIMPLANASILTAVLSAVMAVFVLLKAPKRKITALWVLTCLSIALWSFGFGMMTRSVKYEDAFFWQKWVLYAGSIMIPVLYLHFVSLLVGFNIKRVLIGSYCCAFILEGLNVFDLLATMKIKPPFLFYTDAILPNYHFFTLYFFMLASYAHWLLLKRLRTAEGALKNQIQYVFCGTAVGFVGGSMTFPLTFDIHVFPVGVYLVAFYLVAVTYAMYKHQLMDISLVFRRGVVYSMMTVVLTAIYLVAITQGTHVLQSLFGASTLTVSVLAACFISAIFLPLRDRIQSFVDHYFFPMWSDREVVREVAAGFSHELKSPLAGLSMQAQLTLADLEGIEKDPEAFRAAIPRIKEELHYLVNKSMEAARRIEAVRGVAESVAGQIEAVNIPIALDNSLLALKPLLAQVSPEMHRLIPSNLPPVRSNLKQLEIVFINLMKNALEAMDGLERAERHALALVGSEQDNVVLVSIKDTGAGIAAKDLRHVFEPYYSTKGRKGTGMGLFLAHQIVQAHSGSIEVKSEAGKGTEFIVRLPKFEQKAAA